MDYHTKRGDKVLVFSDDKYALESYATKMGFPYIHGDVTPKDREFYYNGFKNVKNDIRWNCLFVSRVADNSIDLPANVLIQIFGQEASRRQEAQRLGRVLRPKNRINNEYNGFFYSIVSNDTREVALSVGRRRFLVEQGYSYMLVRKPFFLLQFVVYLFFKNTQDKQS